MNFGKKNGFVATGGGAKCAFQAGCLLCFEEEFGITFDIMAGTSGGALNVLKYVESGAKATVAVWHHFEKEGYSAIFSRFEAAKHYLSGPALYGDKGLNKLVSGVDMAKVITSPILMEIVARNELTNKPQVIKNHDFQNTPEDRETFRRLIKASASFPGLFHPERMLEQVYSDGCECMLDSFADCDTIFFVETDQPVGKIDPDVLVNNVWDVRLRDLVNYVINRLIEKEVQRFIATHKFKPFPEDPEESDSPRSIWGHVLEVFKDFGKDLAGLPEKRIVKISPSMIIPTLGLDKFDSGKRDLTRSIEHGYRRTKEIVGKLLS